MQSCFSKLELVGFFRYLTVQTEDINNISVLGNLEPNKYPRIKNSGISVSFLWVPRSSISIFFPTVSDYHRRFVSQVVIISYFTAHLYYEPVVKIIFTKGLYYERAVITMVQPNNKINKFFKSS